MNDFLQNLRNTQLDEQKSQPKTRKTFDNSYHPNTNARFHSHGSFTRPAQHVKRAPSHPVHSGPAQKAVSQSGTVESPLLADAIENLTTHVEALVKTQEYTAAIQEKISGTFERQIQVFEEMVSLFQTFLGNHGGAGNFQAVGSNASTDENKVSRTDSPVSHVVKEKTVSQKQHTQGDGSLFGRQIRPVVRKRVRTESVSRPETVKETSVDDDHLMGRREIMDIIHSMREKGATFDQVAKYLTDLGQPTFSGRGEWHAQTVHRLCNK